MENNDIQTIQVIKILNRKFNLRFIECEDWGEIKYNPNEIIVNEKLCLDDQKITILHEVVHGIIFAFGHEKINKNEDLVQALAEGFYDFIKKNNILIERMIHKN